MASLPGELGEVGFQLRQPMLPRPGCDFGARRLPNAVALEDVAKRSVQILHTVRLTIEIGVQTNGHNTTALCPLGIKDIEGIADHPLELLAFGLEFVRKDVIVVHRLRHADQIAVLGTDRHRLIIVIVVRDISEPLFGREFGGVKGARGGRPELAVELRPVGFSQDINAVANSLPRFVLGEVP